MDDRAHLALSAWAAWAVDGRPLAFNAYPESLCGREFEAHHRRTFRDDVPLWRDDDADWLFGLDGRLRGALTAAERRVLLAACAPLGRACPAPERAAAAGCDVETLRAIRRRALALVEVADGARRR